LRTQAGKVVGISMTTSNFLPLSATHVGIEIADELLDGFLALEEVWAPPVPVDDRDFMPRASACSTCSGPVNPVPPMTKMLSGAAARSIGRREPWVCSSSAPKESPGVHRG
jgi:hypothetical protein